MSYSKYTREERKIVFDIHQLEIKMNAARKRYLEYDTKRIAMIHELKGKYDSKQRY